MRQNPLLKNGNLEVSWLPVRFIYVVVFFLMHTRLVIPLLASPIPALLPFTSGCLTHPSRLTAAYPSSFVSSHPLFLTPQKLNRHIRLSFSPVGRFLFSTFVKTFMTTALNLFLDTFLAK